MLGLTPLGGAAIADGKLPTTSGPAPSIWTIPFTWTDETDVPGVGSADFNVEIRDHLNVLKTPLDASGKIRALDSTCFRNLSASEITGVLLHPGVDQPFVWPDGTYDFNGTGGRLRVPFGTDAGLDAGPGSVWMEKVGPVNWFLAWNDETNTKRVAASTSAAVNPIPGKTGSLWLNPTSGILEYAAEARKWRATSTTLVESSSPGLAGSLWVEGAHLHYVDAAGQEWLVEHA